MTVDQVIQRLKDNGFKVTDVQFSAQTDYDPYYSVRMPVAIGNMVCQVGSIYSHKNAFHLNLNRPYVVNLAIDNRPSVSVFYEGVYSSTLENLTEQELSTSITTIQEACDKLPQAWNTYIIQNSANDLRSLTGSCNSQ